jgi:hypothetical protein
MLAHAGAADESLAIAMVFAALWVGWIGWSRLRGKGFARLPRWGAFAALGVAVTLLVASAVVPRAIFPVTSTPGVSGTAGIASTATLSFREPVDGAVLANDEVRVLLLLDGGRVVEGTTPVSPDTGHLHLSVDGKLVSMTYGTVQIVDLRPYEPGPHTLRAEFVAADHRPFDPPVVATIGFVRAA